MLKNSVSKIVFYTSEEDGKLYCPRHAQRNMIAIYESDNENGWCSVCGERIGVDDEASGNT